VNRWEGKHFSHFRDSDQSEIVGELDKFSSQMNQFSYAVSCRTNFKAVLDAVITLN